MQQGIAIKNNRNKIPSQLKGDKMTELPIEKIEENWRTYEKILSRLEDSSINKFLEVSGERLAICPLNRSTTFGRHGERSARPREV